VCVKLDNDNGGILLNLGKGGLSFQAVAKLNRDQNLILHLKLPDIGEAIRIEGSVAWLGPTRKEAGICFRDLPERAQQSISEWIEKEGRPSAATELKVAPRAKPSPTTTEIPLLPPRIDNQVAPFLVKIMEPRPKPSTALPRESALADSLPDSDGSGPSVPLVAMSLPVPIPTPPIHPGEHSAALLANPNKLSPEPLQTKFQPKPPGPFGLYKKLPWTEGILPALPKLSPSERKGRRQILVVAGLASCLGILALMVMSTDHPKAEPVLNVSSPTAIAPGGPADGTMLQSQQQTMASPSAAAGFVTPETPIPASPTVVRQDAEAGWGEKLRKMFLSNEDTAGFNSSLIGVPVWTYAQSGYYYCANSPYFAKLEPGSIMAQSDALQSGYQPKLGSYCH
jgi:hypothetical protein